MTDSKIPKPPLAGSRQETSAVLWTALNFGTNLITRFVANVVLTRLLSPHAFGIMALVRAVLMGVQMFSDAGVDAVVVQNARGADPRLIQTVWTVQAIRGLILFAIVCLLAQPIAAYFGVAELAMLLTVGGLSFVFTGFWSSGLALLNRRLHLGRLTVIESASQIAAAAATIALAWLLRNEWALVIGMILGSVFQLVLSHALVRSVRMRFVWEPSYLKEVISFSKWIFAASASTFLVNRFDRILLGGMMTLEMLGVYAVAVMIAPLPADFTRLVSRKVLFPLLSRLADSPDERRPAIFRFRLKFAAALLPMCIFLLVFAPELVGFLFDARYQDAGRMAQILLIGSTATVVFLPTGTIALASGNSRLHLMIVGSRAVTTVFAMAIGAFVSGADGLLWGLAFAPFAHYPLLVWAVRREQVWLPALDLACIGAAAGMAFAGFAAKSVWLG